jgi:hypothetical protein
MNRAVCLQRPEPTASDIELTGKCIIDLGTSSQSWPWLVPMAQAYHEIYTSQGGRDFVGMRDFYSLVKQLRLRLRGTGEDLTPDLLNKQLLRNFNGKPELAARVVHVFQSHVFGASASAAPQPPLPGCRGKKEKKDTIVSRHQATLCLNSFSCSAPHSMFSVR